MNAADVHTTILSIVASMTTPHKETHTVSDNLNVLFALPDAAGPKRDPPKQATLEPLRRVAVSVRQARDQHRRRPAALTPQLGRAKQMARSKKKPGSRMESLTGALIALTVRPLEVVLKHIGPLPDGARLDRTLISTVVAKDKTTVIKVYREEVVRDDVVALPRAGAS